MATCPLFACKQSGQVIHSNDGRGYLDTPSPPHGARLPEHSRPQAPAPLRPQAQMLSIFDEILHRLVHMTPNRPVGPQDAADANAPRSRPNIPIQVLADASPQLIGLDNSDKSSSSKPVRKQRTLTFLVKLPHWPEEPLLVTQNDLQCLTGYHSEPID